MLCAKYIRIRTIRKFCCANLRSELLRNNPRIAHANLGSARNLLGSRNQTPAIRGTNPRSIAHAKQLGHPPQRSDNRSRTFACAIDRGFVAADGRIWLRDPRRLRADPRFAQQNPRIRGLRSNSSDPMFTCAILGLFRSEVCAVKSSDGPNPYFAHNIYTEKIVHV